MLLVSELHANAATSVVNFDPASGMLSVTGACSGRFVLVVIKKSSDGSIWGSSNPPCASGSYSYSLTVPDGVRTGAAFSVSAMDNGVSGTSGTISQPVIFSPAPGIDQTATSTLSDLSIAIDTSSLAVDPNSTSFLDGVLQDCFGVVTSALNTAEASFVAAIHMFAKFFTIIPGGSIMVPRGQNQISGQGTLAAGASEVFIANTSVTSSSQIIVTPTSPSQLPLAVVQITDGSGFDVGTISPQQIPISFNWLIVGTYAAGSPTQAGLQQGSQSAGVIASSTDGSSPAGTIDGSSTDDTSDASSTVVATTTDITDIASTTDTRTTDTVMPDASTTDVSVADSSTASGTRTITTDTATTTDMITTTTTTNATTDATDTTQ